MAVFSSTERYEKRKNKQVLQEQIVSERKYNTVLSGVVLYGLIINVIICALLGDSLAYVSPLKIIIPYFIFTITGMLMSVISKNPIVSFIGYNFVVLPIGALLSVVVSSVGGIGAGVVLQAFVCTTLVTVIMVILSILYPNFFSKLGRVLGISLLILIIVRLLALIFNFTIPFISWISAAIFSLYIGYDFYKSQVFEKTIDNAIDCALDLYLDIINLFLDILSILSKNDS